MNRITANGYNNLVLSFLLSSGSMILVFLATQLVGEAEEREDGEKMLSPKSHYPEIRALSWDMGDTDPRGYRCPTYSQC